LLVLGGTRFVGRAVVEHSLAEGVHVTLFNRGLTAPDLFPEARQLRGDRLEDVHALGDGEWDRSRDSRDQSFSRDREQELLSAARQTESSHDA
jgi:nucleoside-diphosphate-sugar epimerase